MVAETMLESVSNNLLIRIVCGIPIVNTSRRKMNAIRFTFLLFLSVSMLPFFLFII